MKNTYYFSHDYDARNDEKVMYLIAKHKWEGYGIYWALIELLHQSTNGKLNLNLIEGVAHKLNIEISKLNEVITTCLEAELFHREENYIFSKRVLENLKELNDYREKKSQAGKKGMAKRWGKSNSVITKDNSVITENNTPITKDNKGKESKGKEIRKEKNITKKENFKLEVISTGKEKYDIEMLKDFYEYWSEEDKNERMRWEKEKTWETPKRLSRWARNNYSQNGRGSPKQKPNGPNGVII